MCSLASLLFFLLCMAVDCISLGFGQLLKQHRIFKDITGRDYNLCCLMVLLLKHEV